MHTQNVKVQTAGEETAGRCGEGQDLAAVARERVAQATSLKEGVKVTVSEITKYGDVQVEIRTCGVLNWRAWSFEPEFLPDLDLNLKEVQQK